MDLNINSPAYYTNIYGIDDEIYWMCRELSKSVKEKGYSELINIIGIVPIVAPIEEVNKGLWKEIKKCEVDYGIATVSLRIDYDEYLQADLGKKKALIINNLLKSVKAVSKKGKIDFNRFQEDIISFCEMTGVNYP